jgi:hypothetical protein
LHHICVLTKNKFGIIDRIILTFPEAVCALCGNIQKASDGPLLFQIMFH